MTWPAASTAAVTSARTVIGSAQVSRLAAARSFRTVASAAMRLGMTSKRRTMHTYRKTGKDEDTIFTVGFDRGTPEGMAWHPLRDFKNEMAASAYVSFLNGGGEGEYRSWYLNEWRPR